MARLIFLVRLPNRGPLSPLSKETTQRADFPAILALTLRSTVISSLVLWYQWANKSSQTWGSLEVFTGVVLLQRFGEAGGYSEVTVPLLVFVICATDGSLRSLSLILNEVSPTKDREDARASDSTSRSKVCKLGAKEKFE